MQHIRQTDKNDSLSSQVQDFSYLTKIGEGAFGNVFLAKQKKNNYLLAIKVMDKAHILKNELAEQVNRERLVMAISTRYKLTSDDCLNL